MRGIKRIFGLLIILLMVIVLPMQSFAKLKNIEGNDIFHQDKIPVGKTGKIMNVTFYVETGSDYDNAWAGIAYDDDDDEELEFPFELTSETTDRKHIGKITKGKKKSVTISARVRRDIAEGYYGIPVYLADGENGGKGAQEYINVYIQKSTTAESSESEAVKDVEFTLGEGQSTPRGTYPDVLNFSLNLANTGKLTAFDVTAHMVMDKDNTVFPFEINDANYDRHFDKIESGGVTSLDYSFAIQKNTYTGYYPIKLEITYRDSTEGELKKAEEQFFVHIKNKEKDETTTAAGEFNPNDRTKARIVVDSFRTEPKNVYAGDAFELIIVMKNASASVPASNILFTLESEKANDSAVFSIEEGSSSHAVNSLPANQTTELRLKMIARAGVDQRSYSITINEQYDSPEYKNATDKVTVDIPVKQVARMNIGSFEINPESISVGDDANITFQINNTGKVVLYNLMAKFKADSIKENEAYVGNIKPGETGNVDVNLTGKAVTTDDGKISLTISYEDENGNITEETRDFILNVNEEMETEIDMLYPDVTDEETKQPNAIPVVIGGIGAAVIAGVIVLKKRKSKKEQM